MAGLGIAKRGFGLARVGMAKGGSTQEPTESNTALKEIITPKDNYVAKQPAPVKKRPEEPTNANTALKEIKSSTLFKGKETYSEELKEATALKKGKITKSDFVKGEKSEGHKEEEKGAAKIAKKIASGKMSPKQYATMETSEKMAKGGKVEKVMHEFKTGKLHSGKKGPVVKSRKQAIAIALSEAGKSKMANGGKPGLWANINARKKAGTSRPKSESTISPKAYANMKAGFPKKKK